MVSHLTAIASLSIAVSDPSAPAEAPNVLAIAPFAALLLCIAILPLIEKAERWWSHNRNKLIVALSLAVVTLAYYGATFGGAAIVHVLDHAVLGDYVPFIAVLFALYVISGGISLIGDLPAHPRTNTAFLAVGAVLASFIGTTGASMLLIRPLLATNSERRNVRHTVVFFIFIVSNAGGMLLPLGDPPLFLGFLRGVPFLWTLGLWPAWLICNALLLATYFAWDCAAYRRESPENIIWDEAVRRPLKVHGSINLLWLLGVVACVALVTPDRPLPGTTWVVPHLVREALLMALVVLSLMTTPKGAREEHGFNYHAIIEVAALFIGLFITMQAPLDILRHGAGELSHLLSTDRRFFWISGALSSVLDNAPTYSVFFQCAESLTNVSTDHVLRLVDGGAVRMTWLTGVSLGTVLMGANTYIGNGPNFMVRSIAEQSGVKMPSFFGYMRYSLLVMVPLYLVVTWMLLRGQ